MKHNKPTYLTLLILTLIILPNIWTTHITAQGPEPPPPKETQFNGTMISWSKQQNTTQENWSWTNQAWEFGPYPRFAIYLQNGTEVTDANCISLGEPFKIVIIVQKTIFTGNNTLGRAGLQWHTEIRSQNGTVTGNANCKMVYVNQMLTRYWNESNTWHVESFVFNQSEVTAPMGKPPQPPEQTRQLTFYNFNRNSSKSTETSEAWTIEIVGSFNATSTPIGPYWVNLEVTDSSDQWIDFGYQAWSGKTSPNRMIAVGRPGFNYGGFQDFWTFEKLDMENRPVYSVSKGAPWKMRFNVTSSQLENITVGLDLDWNVRTFVNVTGWYQKSITERGGWIYNETSGTYYWNSTVLVTKVTQVFGPHLEERWTHVSHDHRVNITRQYWDPETGEQRFVNETFFANERMYLVYDHSNHTFTVKQGYSYWGYDPELRRDREFTFLYPLNTSDPTTRFYNLSLSDCSWQKVAPNRFVIEFVGAFSNSTYSERDKQGRYGLSASVYGKYGQMWANWEALGASAFEIAVDQLTAITTIIDSHGRLVKGWMFQINPGEFFIIKSELQGAAVKYRDIDGVGVVFRTGGGRWDSANESYWSDVEIRLIKDLTTNTINSVTYNRTGKNAYVYGSHRGWALVNVTDWHMEYNSTTGQWDWVESPHLIWNETTLTDWHWEYLSLNQTEYALDPNSPNIWMDRQRTWVSDEDPAFKTPSSYASLNSANISLVQGLVTVNMNVTFSPSAPQSNYWWNVVFKNMTYGRDWTKGWDEHTVTEWTSEPIYYVNGTATDNQAWYMTKPSTPLYTMYNGRKYKLEQTPYITIGGVDLPIRVRTQYDSWRQEEWRQLLFYDQYDPRLGTQPRYYELLNGTKIYVKEGYRALIRTIQLNCTGAYAVVEGEIMPVPNATVFNTFMDRAVQDWSRRFWDPAQQRDVAPYFYELLNGTRIYRNEGFETQNYNWTTYRWELSDTLYTEEATTLMVDYIGRGVTLNQTVVLLREPGWWQNLPDGTGYYLVMKNGTRIIHEDPWSVPDDQRIVVINGLRYLVSWPTEYYSGTFEGSSLMIRGGGWEGYVQRFYYTDLGVEGGTKHELPYPGAMATSWWELEGVESEDRKLRTTKSVTINGTKYVLYPSEDKNGYYIVVDGERVPVTIPAVDVGYYYAQINGEEYWNIVQNGWILHYGAFSDRSGQFSSSGSLTSTTGYDPMGHTWSEHNRYGYDRENATLYIQTTDGTRYDLHSEMYIIVWKVQIGDKQYYTTDPYDRWETTYDNKTGQTYYTNYIQTLNGTKVYFTWDRNPANWLEEIHVPVPGTNYTRLVPYSWQPQEIFDTVNVFNITIPELPYNPGHTGVFFENGTEVSVGTAFKVFGTPRGPGTHYNPGWFDGRWSPNGAYIPSTQAPWNSSHWVQYFTTIEENRIYSYSNFGWMGDHWGDQKQWKFIYDDPVAGNKTARVVEGGYRVYLNNTIKVDVTTRQPQGGMPDQYLIMKNGTSFNIHWNFDMQIYVTTIDGRRYFFRQVVTYYNLTDAGTIYNIADPLEFDQYQIQYRILTPTIYQAPVINPDRTSWVLMNSTSDAVLHDLTGYYVINASNLNRLDLMLVNDWWDLSEQVRRSVFQSAGELSDMYPRYNVTVNGLGYFVLDPSPVVGRWDGEWSIEQALYRYPRSISVTLGGTPYEIVLFEQSGYWRSDIRRRRFETIQLSGSKYEVEEQHQWKPSYQVTIDGQSAEIELATMNIYKRHTIWGEVYGWMLTDLNVYTLRSINDIIVGMPRWGMWGIRAFDTVPETGAVDLDGDLTTTSDQYFVRRVRGGSDLRNETVDRMWVELIWDPNSSRIGDEIHIGAWMGKLHVAWTSEWNETYYWYYASNVTIVSPETMQQINATVLDSATGRPNPGYWDIAHMVKNSTWADVLDQAKREGWDWITENKNEWEWLWFGTQQDYRTSWVEGDTTKEAGIGLRYEFAGLSLFNNTEQTHFFMPKNIGNITFVTPGEAFGNMNATDSMIVSKNTTVTFGVSFDGINGTLFPFSEDRSMWGWWDRPVFGADFNVPNFMNRPTESAVDRASFLIHFNATATEGAELNNEASMKIDQYIGNWELDPNIIDGRQQNASGVMVYLMGNDVLLNRSLATNYYVTAMSALAWDVMDESGQSVDNNNVTESSQFSVASRLANATFATVKLGSTYDWGKPTSATDVIRTLNVTSKTSPIGAFRASYQSDAGKSSTGFDISAMMYFLTVGFQNWDGYPITNDPEVLLRVSKGVLYVPGPEEGGQPGGALPPPTTWYLLVLAGSLAAVVVVLVVFRDRVKGLLSRLRSAPEKSSDTPKEARPSFSTFLSTFYG